MRRPWMRFFPGDYLADTTHLSTTEHGAYMLLILAYWQRKGLPDDDEQLARITRLSPRLWQLMRPTMASLFKPGWRHPRIDHELAEAEKAYQRRASAGKKGGEAKASRSSIATAMPQQPEPEPEPKDGGGGDARARDPLVPSEAGKIADEVAVACGHDPTFLPPQWIGAEMHVAGWLREGATRETILAAVKGCLASKRDGPPSSIRYFARPVAKMMAQTTEALPVIRLVPQQEVIHEGHRNGNNGSGHGVGAQGVGFSGYALRLARQIAEEGR
jgi:uncharacterized protein YdaU (DUF1376 family)